MKQFCLISTILSFCRHLLKLPSWMNAHLSRLCGPIINRFKSINIWLGYQLIPIKSVHHNYFAAKRKHIASQWRMEEAGTDILPSKYFPYFCRQTTRRSWPENEALRLRKSLLRKIIKDNSFLSKKTLDLLFLCIKMERRKIKRCLAKFEKHMTSTEYFKKSVKVLTQNFMVNNYITSTEYLESL